MITDIINRKISEMKALRRLEQAKKNQAQQAIIDKKYQEMILSVRNLVEAIQYSENNLGFVISDSTKQSIITFLGKMKGITKTGNADKDELTKADTEFKTLQANVKKEWDKYFLTYTSTVTNTLRVIRGINPDKISECMSSIKAAENWTVDKTVFSTLKTAMDSADLIIQELNMGAEVIQFLTTMAAGNATIADLNDSVLSWIKSEALEKKIKLSFTSR